MSQAVIARSQRSLRCKLAIPLLGSGILLAAIALMAMQYHAEKQLENALLSRAKLIASMIDFSVSSVSRNGDLQRIVSAIGAEPDINDIVVIGGTPLRVIASTKMAFLNHLLPELPKDSVADDFYAVMNSGRELAVFNRGENFFDYTGPVSVARTTWSETSAPEGAVMVHLDSHRQQNEIANDTLRFALGLLTCLGVITGLGYASFSRFVLAPLRRIAAALNNYRSGKTKNLELQLASDELGHLADVLKRSFHELQITTRDLRNQKFALDQHSLVSITDANGAIIYANPKFCSVCGYSQAELMGQSHRIISSRTHSKEFFAELWGTIKAGRVWHGQLCNRAKDGSIFWNDSTIVPLLDEAGVADAFIAIRTDITALREAQANALAANRAKSEFLAIMSHEMRTPLNGIIGTTNELLDTDLKSNHQEQLADIEDSAKSLLNIINDVLDLSKVEVGKLQLQPQEFNVGELMRRVLDLIQPKAAEKEIEIHLLAEDSLPDLIVADETRLRQSVLNILGNAIKFSAPGGTIIILTESRVINETTYSLSIAIADTGIGIAADKLEAIFQPFSQLDSSNSRNFGGTGLGLSIAKTFVKTMGGDISVRSIPDVGSRFSIEIPVSTTLPVPSKSVEQQIVKAAPKRFPCANILVVEDNVINQKVVVRMLEKMGCHVTLAVNGAEAVKLYHENIGKYSLLLMDCQMPVMDGFQATEEIRRIEESSGQRVPIVALTANVMVGDAKLCLDAGMDGYLPKPLDRKALETELTKFIK
jgi:PAS domain S-box-containing protein